MSLFCAVVCWTVKDAHFWGPRPGLKMCVCHPVRRSWAAGSDCTCSRMCLSRAWRGCFSLAKHSSRETGVEQFRFYPGERHRGSLWLVCGLFLVSVGDGIQWIWGVACFSRNTPLTGLGAFYVQTGYCWWNVRHLKARDKCSYGRRATSCLYGRETIFIGWVGNTSDGMRNIF